MSPSFESRRGFLESLGRHGAGALVASTATSASLQPARGGSANETIRVACIGTGGRCRRLMESLARVPDVKMAAVCDIYDQHLDLARKLADPKAFVTKRYVEVLDRKDIDAILIGAPDHWHVPMTVAACNAGKDVYVEKPLTHDPAEGSAVVAAQDRNKRVVQVGTQQRSMPHFQKGRELLKAGRIGEVVKIHLSWNRNVPARTQRKPLGIDANQVDWKAFLGNAPAQPFDEYRFRNWRWYWDFGGGILTDLMVHFIDVAHWFLDLDHPLNATTIGVHSSSNGVWETPDTIQTLLSYPGNLQVHFEGTFSNAFHGAMIAFMGTKGTLYLDRGRYELIPERGQGEPESWILGTKPNTRGADFYDQPDGELLHLTNWIDCVRSRRTPNCPAAAGVGAAAAAHLGNRAYRTGQVATWSEA